jgi:HAD superfamily hydrolase (TIGR01459 family)
MLSASIPVLSGVADFADGYDAFVLDLWGVLHDGVQAYDGARSCLEELKKRGKRIVLLSNAPRRSTTLIDLMADMGLPPHCYDEILTSGDAVHYMLRDRAHPVFAALGQKVFYLGSDTARDVLDGLPYVLVDSPAEADFVLLSGPESLDDPLEKYEPIVADIAKTMPFAVCANPDRAVIRQGKNVVCAGNIADLYTALGGRVHEVGKPDPAVYDLALARLGITDRRRVVGVGDSFATDMRGCAASGIDGVLCARGIHARAFGVAPGQAPSSEAVTALAQEYEVMAKAAIPAFVW